MDMTATLFSTALLPAYHDGLLIVSVRKEALVSGSASLASMAAISTVSPSSTGGLSALAFYERAGMIRRVVPLRRDIPRETGIGREPQSPRISALSALMASAASSAKDDPNHGVSIIEIERGHDTQSLRMALANDPNIASVSKVPKRYLAARPARARAAKPALTTIAAAPPATTM